jgi:fluoride exporter
LHNAAEAGSCAPVIKEALLVFVGGGAGSVLRYAAGRAAAASLGVVFPWGTFLVNIVGSLAAGLLIGWLGTRGAAEPGTARLLLMTGFLGGFTTFSAFSIDAVSIAGRQPGLAAAYVSGSVALSLAAAMFGLWLVRGAASPL